MAEGELVTGRPLTGRVLVDLVACISLVMASAPLFTGPGGSDASAATAPFMAGTGSATAEVIALPLALAGADEGVTEGLSNAGYTNMEGQAESEVVASGLSGALPIPTPASLLPLQTSSTGSLSSTTRSIAGSAGAGAATEAVAASESSGLASTSVAGLSAGSSLVISGGQSTAASSIVGGDARQAESTSQIGTISLLGGLVMLSGLDWSSTQRSGANPVGSSSFSIASVTLGGVNLPVAAESLSSVFSTINAAIATTGFHISPPQSKVASNGTVSETPLSIGLDNSALGMQAFGPVVSGVQPLRNVLFNELASIYPTTGDADLFVEIVLGILAGQGAVDINVGGTTASTSNVTYVDPFGASTGASTEGPAPTSSFVPGTAGSSIITAAGGFASPGPVTTTTSTPAGPTTKGASTRRSGVIRLASSTSCRSTTVGGCRSSAAKPVALILVLGTAALALAEFLRQRRRRRNFSAETPEVTTA